MRLFTGNAANYLAIATDVAALELLFDQSIVIRLRCDALGTIVASKGWSSSGTNRTWEVSALASGVFEYRVLRSSGAEPIVTAGQIKLGQFQVIGISQLSGVTIQAFVNGIPGATASLGSNALHDSTGTLKIGRREDTASPFIGLIDYVAIWNGVLTQAEHIQLAAGADPTTIRRGSLTLNGYWKMDHAGNEPDLSANQNQLVQNGTVPPLTVHRVTRRAPEPLPIDDAATVTLNLTPSPVEVFGPQDAETALLAFTPFGSEVSLVDAATAPLSFTPSGTEQQAHVYVDTGTAALSLLPSGTDCLHVYAPKVSGSLSRRWDGELVKTYAAALGSNTYTGEVERKYGALLTRRWSGDFEAAAPETSVC